MAIEVGQKVNGKVSGITNFGAFVDLGNDKTGLVHISEVSDGFVKDIHDVLKVGDDVVVKVLKVDDKKISLSIRKASDRPKPKDQDSNHHGGHATRNHDSNRHYQGNANSNRRSVKKTASFDDLMSGFLKDSEDRLSTLRKNTEGKRGGRGGRRS
ncbi:S1 domain-containing RNA-binding protein [Lentilactobacillus laojiaonis]|uniref:S1 domain-containing RNA-binding protein n=1 Tax=Lentilactobacillus laojiaonis TaxID=2883998 RepID=UPI001D0A102D|nr:S1 domain-containing RNA-binding protein [Lentilactobacillus laojiaonis]UDM31915.1 RNA-binding protein S1 [Lentilactobacillus laojiaonis]